MDWAHPRSIPGSVALLQGRSFELMGEAFLVAPEEDVHAMVRDMSNNRGSTLPPGWEEMMMTEYMTALLPSGAIDRLAEYEQQ